MDFSRMSLIELVDGIKKSDFTARAVQEYFLARAHERNSELNAFLTIIENTEDILAETPLA